ncbi:MAG: WD40 repeat domain-containing protein [Methanosarcinales archaeon]|nr:WD40 repeat domain-containing protein [Methanosarcinales archaeon]
MNLKNISLIIISVLAFSMLVGCIGEETETVNTQAPATPMPESTETQPMAGVPIDSISFMRTGAHITLGSDEAISAINIYNDRKQLISQNVETRVKEVFADLDWDSNARYKFEVVTDSGAVSTSDVYAPAKPALVKVDTIELEDVEPGEIIKTTNNVEGILRFSPDSRYLAIGTHEGNLRIIDLTTGDGVFEKKISEGHIISMDFSPDSMSLYVTEESMDGFIYCFDLDGTEQWKFRTADEFGSDLKYMPYARKMAFDSDGNMYATGRRSGGYIGGTYQYSTRLYAFDPEGNIRWKFPESGIMDAGLTWVDATPDGKYVVFGTSGFGPVENWKDETVHVLNGETGEELWSYRILPLEPYFNSVALWYGTTITPDGKYVTALASDGRGFLFNNSDILSTGEAEPMWQRDISTPMMVSSIPIYGSANYAYNIDDTVIFSTGNTFSRAKGEQPPIEHPGGNSLYAYDLEGNLLWKWRVEGYAGELGIGDHYLAAPISQNLVTNNIDVHGVYVFDLSQSGGATSKLTNVYRTEGITIASDVSPDGRYIAAFEAPARLEDGSVIGDYRVHILR